jgi:hypothetical protein
VLGRDENSARNILKEKSKKEWEEKQQDSYEEDDCNHKNEHTKDIASEAQTLLFR